MKAFFQLWISGMLTCWDAIAHRSQASQERSDAGIRFIDRLDNR